MKFAIGVTLFLTQGLQAQAFSPASSFTSFQTSHSFQRDAFSTIQPSRQRKGTEMRLMFDQLSNAITEVAKNIGGRQRSVNTRTYVFPF
jgi:hypothetical protein